LKLYLSQLSRELRLRRGQSNDDQVFESIAARMGLDAHEIKEEFEVAEAAVKNESVEYRSAARIIRRLALIRAAVTGKV
jgi:protein-disulfide isomerase-like protein with CxxC motif